MVSSAPTMPTATRLLIQGTVHGGSQPILGAHIYLFAANTTGYGGNGSAASNCDIPASNCNSSISLLNYVSGSTTQDTTSGDATYGDYYVASGSNGGFSITSDYTPCTSSSTTQVYLYALGGNTGAGNNSASGLMAALGTCSNLSSATNVNINEVTTVAAAYALAGFATDAIHISSSGTALAQTGITNAFSNAANLATTATGVAVANPPDRAGLSSNMTVDSVANMLASCVNTADSVNNGTSTFSTACSSLFALATSNGTPSGTEPSNTATAAVNIAHNPAANVATLFATAAATASFQPTFRYQPYDFTVALAFTGTEFDGPTRIRIDAEGNAWIADQGAGVSALSPSGSLLFSAKPIGTRYQSNDISIDRLGNAWAITTYGNAVAEFSTTGAMLKEFGLTSLELQYGPNCVGIDAKNDVWVGGGELSNSSYAVELSGSGAIAAGTAPTGGNISASIATGFDGFGNAWFANYSSASVTKLSSSAIVQSGANGYSTGAGTPRDLAMDSSGSAWIALSTNSSSTTIGPVMKLSNSGSVLVSQNYLPSGETFFDGEGIAIDGAGDVWATLQLSNRDSVLEYSNSGTLISPSSGYTNLSLDFPQGIAVDGSGDVWIADEAGYIIELIGAAVPVITPISAGLPTSPTSDGTSMLGTRP